MQSLQGSHHPRALGQRHQPTSLFCCRAFIEFVFVTDDGKGTKEIFRVQNFDLVPLDEGVNGKFFGGDSYVIKYSYEKGGGQGHIIYFWQVLESETIKSEIVQMKTFLS